MLKTPVMLGPKPVVAAVPNPNQPINPTQVIDIRQETYVPEIKDIKLKLMIYGKPGQGKTTLAATAESDPRLAPTLFINAESGTLAIVADPKTGVNKTPEVYDLKDPNTGFPDFKRLERAYSYLAFKEHPFKTVVIDTASEVAKLCLDTIVAKGVGKKTKSGSMREDMDDVWVEDYGDLTMAMRRIFRKFRDLPMHVIMTAHEQTNKAETEVFASFTPKLRESVVAMVDILGCLTVAKDTVDTGRKDAAGKAIYGVRETRKLITDSALRYEVKDRSPGGRLGGTMEFPTMTKIYDAITGEKLNG